MSTQREQDLERALQEYAGLYGASLLARKLLGPEPPSDTRQGQDTKDFLSDHVAPEADPE